MHGNYKHGEQTTPEYRCWRGLRHRCLSPKSADWSRYGGRGITIDPTWNDFRVFLADMGRKPSLAHTIERKDNSRGYSKGNCVWVLGVEQARNRRNVKLSYAQVADIRRLHAAGHRQKDLAVKYGVNPTCISRVVNGRRWA